MIEKNQRLTDEQFTIAFRRNSPLRERLSLEAPSDNREKKKEKRVYSALRENFNIFIAREARARARSAPEDTNKRLRTIHRKPDGRRTFGQKRVPLGPRVLLLVILGGLSKKNPGHFSVVLGDTSKFGQLVLGDPTGHFLAKIRRLSGFLWIVRSLLFVSSGALRARARASRAMKILKSLKIKLL